MGQVREREMSFGEIKVDQEKPLRKNRENSGAKQGATQTKRFCAAPMLVTDDGGRNAGSNSAIPSRRGHGSVLGPFGARA